ncbi:hypothetical protein DM860_015044 [Cuscuta australis]|uniref:DUF4283 domain-containing protein n=1 Tax=Cuscuta australis TaxID=267555 RepID=A0A328DY46_9ASTE|nr:hypothetical protein DM860_015044 [Cuscuta australis]
MLATSSGEAFGHPSSSTVIPSNVFTFYTLPISTATTTLTLLSTNRWNPIAPKLGKSYAAVMVASSHQGIPITLPPREVEKHKGLPCVAFSSEEASTLASRFSKALVGSFYFGRPSLDFIRHNLERIGYTRFSVTLLDKAHILLNFSIAEDYHRCFKRREWMLGSFKMTISKWTPHFDPKLESPIVPIWISIQDLPIHLHAKESLLCIGQIFGNPIKLDVTIEYFGRPSLIRICVEVDISKPQINKFVVHDGTQPLFLNAIYEEVPDYCQDCKGIAKHNPTCKHKHLNTTDSRNIPLNAKDQGKNTYNKQQDKRPLSEIPHPIYTSKANKQKPSYFPSTSQPNTTSQNSPTILTPTSINSTTLDHSNPTPSNSKPNSPDNPPIQTNINTHLVNTHSTNSTQQIPTTITSHKNTSPAYQPTILNHNNKPSTTLDDSHFTSLPIIPTPQPFISTAQPTVIHSLQPTKPQPNSIISPLQPTKPLCHTTESLVTHLDNLSYSPTPEDILNTIAGEVFNICKIGNGSLSTTFRDDTGIKSNSSKYSVTYLG